MKEILRALAPAKRRLRLGNALRFGGMGLLSGAGLSLALLIASFFSPIPGKLWLCLGLIAGMTALPFAAGLCWPVKPLAAARAADRAGLQERAQTALTQTGDGPMAQLQRADALHALETLDPRRIPLPQMKRRLLAAGGAMVLSAALLLLPNPQDETARQLADFRQQMAQAAEQIAAAAENPAEELTDAQRQELRRLLQELRRDLRSSDSALDALLALDQGEQRLEQLRETLAAQAQAGLTDALNQAGLSALAEALAAGDERALEEALSQTDPAQLMQAAEGLPGEMQSALQSAAQALQNGNGQQAQATLSQMQFAAGQGQSNALQSASQLMQALRAAASGQTPGQQQGQGNNGQGQQQGQGQSPGQGQGQGNQPGGGAGSGSTNEDQGASAGHNSGSSAGNRDPEYHEGQYEEIYDPTRLQASETQQTAQNARGDGESDQAQLGPGAGTQGDSVPYNEVVNEYAAAAAQAADSQSLSRQERQWVDDYFSALTRDAQGQ